MQLHHDNVLVHVFARCVIERHDFLSDVSRIETRCLHISMIFHKCVKFVIFKQTYLLGPYVTKKLYSMHYEAVMITSALKLVVKNMLKATKKLT